MFGSSSLIKILAPIKDKNPRGFWFLLCSLTKYCRSPESYSSKKYLLCQPWIRLVYLLSVPSSVCCSSSFPAGPVPAFPPRFPLPEDGLDAIDPLLESAVAGLLDPWYCLPIVVAFPETVLPKDEEEDDDEEDPELALLPPVPVLLLHAVFSIASTTHRKPRSLRRW